jgi:hypothetical protein
MLTDDRGADLLHHVPGLDWRRAPLRAGERSSGLLTRRAMCRVRAEHSQYLLSQLFGERHAAFRGESRS